VNALRRLGVRLSDARAYDQALPTNTGDLQLTQETTQRLFFYTGSDQIPPDLKSPFHNYDMNI
jgi:hypothetical protein